MPRLSRSLAVIAFTLLPGCADDPTRSLIAQLQSSDADARIAAARDLGRLGPGTGAAVPALAAALADADPALRQAASRALGEIGPASQAATPELTASLDDREWSVRLAAAFALLKIDSQSDAPHAVLIEAMRQGEGGTIVAIGKLGDRAAWAVPTLTGLLKDQRPGTRRLAAEALTRIGPAARDAASGLRAALTDPDDRVRAAAQEALAAVESRAP